MAILALMAGNFYRKKKDPHLKSGTCVDGQHDNIKNRKTKMLSVYIQRGVHGSRECFPGRILWMGLA